MTAIENSTATKAIIAKAFGNAAELYDKKACIQKQIATGSIQQALQVIGKSHPQVSLDIGCGTGSSSIALLPATERLIGVDIAPGMIDFAKRNHDEARAQWLVGDAEQLPVDNQSVDFLYSCMALQWLEHADGFAAECQRVLRSNGKGLLAILTVGSLFELSETWQEIGIPPSINRFMPSQAWQKSLQQHNIEVIVAETLYTDWHPNLLSVLHSIKDIGAGVTKEIKKDGLTRGQLKKLESAYRLRFEQAQGLPLTYNVCLIKIKKGS